MIFATNMAYLYTLVDKWYYHTSFKIWAKRKGGREKHQLSVGDAATTSAALDTTRKGYRHQLSMLKEQKDNRNWIMKFVTTSKLLLSNRVVTYQKIQLPKLDANSCHPFNQCFDFHFSCAVFQLFAAICHSSISLCIVQGSPVTLCIIRAAIKENAESP